MAFIDKHGLLVDTSRLSGIELELGCGPRKRSSTSIGVDLEDHDCVDVVGDALEVLTALSGGVVDAIRSFHFMEHVSDVGALMAESARVLKPGGTLKIVVPHFSNPYYYSDYTHKTTFGLYSMGYFTNSALFRRRVPQYRVLPLDLSNVTLVFKSSPPFYGRHAIKRLIGLAVNMSRYTQELYEEGVCWLIPCYEIEYLLRKQ
jgi:SAM-dependent methyltransferase